MFNSNVRLANVYTHALHIAHKIHLLAVIELRGQRQHVFTLAFDIPLHISLFLCTPSDSNCPHISSPSSAPFVSFRRRCFSKFFLFFHPKPNRIRHITRVRLQQPLRLLRAHRTRVLTSPSASLLRQCVQSFPCCVTFVSMPNQSGHRQCWRTEVSALRGHYRTFAVGCD